MTESAWIATEATVTTCRYRSPGLSILAFGFQTREKFCITVDYYAHGRLYSDEFQSPTAIPQNEHIPITYNPLHPGQNSLSHASAVGTPSTRAAILAIGIAGSILLSLLWFGMMHGCN